MNIKLFASSVCVICILIGCHDSKKNTSFATLTAHPHEQTVLTEDLTPFIDSVQVISLEVSEESFITHIEKILLTPNKQIIILNSTGILLFDSNGTFQFQIGKIGRAPGEYQKIYDISLDQNGKNLLAVDHNNRVLKYSLSDGQFIQKITPLFPEKYPNCIGIAPSLDNGFFLFGCNPFNNNDFNTDFYCLNQFDKEGKHLNHLLLRKDYTVVTAAITQSYDNSYLIRPQTGDNICYRLKNGDVHPFIKIDFKDEGIPDRYAGFDEEGSYDIQKFLFAPYYKLPTYFHETQNQLYFGCAGPQDADNIFFLINKTNLQGIHWQVVGLSNPNLVLGYASDENYFYYVFRDYNEYDESGLSHDMDPLKKYLIAKKGIKLEGDDSNPLIVKIKFNL